MNLKINFSMEIPLPFTIESDRQGSSRIVEKEGKYFYENILNGKIIKNEELSEDEALAYIKDCFEITRSSNI